MRRTEGKIEGKWKKRENRRGMRRGMRDEKRIKRRDERREGRIYLERGGPLLSFFLLFFSSQPIIKISDSKREEKREEKRKMREWEMRRSESE
jgi:hypothetical protein